jgi:hypothetical protein
MHAVAVERSLPPPSYADKVRARFCRPAAAPGTPVDNTACAQVALAANTEVFPRDAAYGVLNSVTKRVASVVGTSAAGAARGRATTVILPIPVPEQRYTSTG